MKFYAGKNETIIGCKERMEKADAINLYYEDYIGWKVSIEQ